MQKKMSEQYQEYSADENISIPAACQCMELNNSYQSSHWSALDLNKNCWTKINSIFSFFSLQYSEELLILLGLFLCGVLKILEIKELSVPRHKPCDIDYII